jgi:hypothetical protein
LASARRQLRQHNQQSTKSIGGYGNRNGNDDSDDNDNKNKGNGGGGGSAAASGQQQQRHQNSREITSMSQPGEGGETLE